MPTRPPKDAATSDTTPPQTDLTAAPRFAIAADGIPDGMCVMPAPAEYAAVGMIRVMPPDEYAARLARLSAPFPADHIEKLPRALRANDPDKSRCEPGTNASADGYHCGGWHPRSIHLDYVGHAGVTARLLEVDPLWTWEPVATNQDGTPALGSGGAWITLTVLGMTRLGFGDAMGKSGPNATKEVVGDAIRNAAMRFGVATYLWSKSGAAATLRAGGDIDDPPAPQPQTPPPTARTQRRRAAETKAAAPVADAEAVKALRAEVLDVADTTAPGAQRDDLLRALRDRAQAMGALDAPVQVPDPWHTEGRPSTVPLVSLILGARVVVAKSVDGPPAEFDPWATEPPADPEEAQP